MSTNDFEVQNMVPFDNQVQAPAMSVASGHIDYASWLSDDLLLLVGWLPFKANVIQKAMLLLEQQTIAVDIEHVSYLRPDVGHIDPRAGKVVLARLHSSEAVQGRLGRLVIQSGNIRFTPGPADLSEAITNMPTLMQHLLTSIDQSTRDEVMELLARAQTKQAEAMSGLRLSKNLFSIREALRTHLPICVVAPDQPQGLHIETLMAVDEKAFYIRGWMRDEEAKITGLVAISPEGSRVELFERLFYYPRPDVEQFYGGNVNDQRAAKSGFISYFEIGAPSRLTTGWTIEMHNAAGTAIETVPPPVIRDPLTVRNSILADLVHEQLPKDQLMRSHIFPAISRLQERLHQTVAVEQVIQYGTPNPTPDVSVIVPLYGRIDFVEQQMAQFIHDPEILQIDLIYVLDSPELERDLRVAATKLYRLYRVPFRVVTLQQNVGFSAANNAGIGLACGRLLLLLNSDVLPNQPGWLRKMVTFYDSTPGIGALGPKLLYEDDSLQHAGMYFSRPSGNLVWENEHYFKGLHRSLPAALVSRPVPAITGACLLIDRELYQWIGGLRGIYVQGDYEDSDLCLRLIEAGYTNWYLADAELYHLEGQSYPGTLRYLTTRYNLWLHTWLWNERIQEVMSQQGTS